MLDFYVEETRFSKLKNKLSFYSDELLRKGFNFNYSIIENRIDNIDGHLFRFLHIEYGFNIISNGYKLICKISAVPDKENTYQMFTDESVPENFRNSILKCDFCKYDRPKNNIYLVEKDSNYYRISRNCIERYTGISIYVIDTVSLIMKLLDKENLYHTGKMNLKSTKEYFDCSNILNITVDSVMNNGYIKKSDRFNKKNMDSTYSTVMNMIYTDCNVSHYDTVDDIIYWLNRNRDRNDFFRRLYSIVDFGYVRADDIGVLCSLVCLYNNDHNISRSNFFGNKGDIVCIDVTISELAGTYISKGHRIYVYRFVSKNGYVFISHQLSFISDIDSVISIYGTIDRHYVYRNEKQTLLVNVKTKTPFRGL